MSNNKQTVKLYTKENFLKAAEFCEVSMIDARYIISRIDEVTDPIELPSDDEIKKESLKTDFEYTFRNGAMWMRNKIGGGNNEQQ
jgi:hypothetical protein